MIKCEINNQTVELSSLERSFLIEGNLMDEYRLVNGSTRLYEGDVGYLISNLETIPDSVVADRLVKDLKMLKTEGVLYISVYENENEK